MISPSQNKPFSSMKYKFYFTSDIYSSLLFYSVNSVRVQLEIYDDFVIKFSNKSE